MFDNYKEILNELGDVRLTKEEESELIRKVRFSFDENESNDALEKLVFSNYGMIAKMAENYQKYAKFIEIDELISIGMTALIKIIKDKASPNFNNKLMTYALYYVRKDIRNFVQTMNKPMVVPDDLRCRLYRYEKFIDDFFKDNGRFPNEEEVKERLQLTDKEYLEVIEESERIYFSIEDVEEKAKNTFWGEDDTLKKYDNKYLRERFFDCCRNERQKDVVDLVLKGYMFKEISDLLKIDVKEVNYAVIDFRRQVKKSQELKERAKNVA